jgi:GH15 family glucan-1,4-alpha-glucosidase
MRWSAGCSASITNSFAEAHKLFDRLLSRCNDVGLLAEVFDLLTGRMLGNFPQAYSHVGLINSALGLSREMGPAEERAEPQPRT